MTEVTIEATIVRTIKAIPSTSPLVAVTRPAALTFATLNPSIANAMAKMAAPRAMKYRIATHAPGTKEAQSPIASADSATNEVVPNISDALAGRFDTSAPIAEG